MRQTSAHSDGVTGCTESRVSVTSRISLSFGFDFASSSVTGRVPIAGRDDAIKVSWTKDASGLRYSLETPVPLVLHLDAKLAGGEPKQVAVDRTFTVSWPLAAVF